MREFHKTMEYSTATFSEVASSKQLNSQFSLHLLTHKVIAIMDDSFLFDLYNRAVLSKSKRLETLIKI